MFRHLEFNETLVMFVWRILLRFGLGNDVRWWRLQDENTVYIQPAVFPIRRLFSIGMSVREANNLITELKWLNNNETLPKYFEELD